MRRTTQEIMEEKETLRRRGKNASLKAFTQSQEVWDVHD